MVILGGWGVIYERGTPVCHQPSCQHKIHQFQACDFTLTDPAHSRVCQGKSQVWNLSIWYLREGWWWVWPWTGPPRENHARVRVCQLKKYRLLKILLHLALHTVTWTSDPQTLHQGYIQHISHACFASVSLRRDWYSTAQGREIIY